MNWDIIELHRQELFTIIDAAIPNKAQNTAIKAQISASINELMNRFAFHLGNNPAKNAETLSAGTNGLSGSTTIGPLSS